ncbi:Imm31 family immunity protein [Photorhabdus tasmaniensis]|uniref:Immunity protein 31 n=1 Tax=Photorhabdus tasmaniensis TaxID=1004159 RepID=A0ABX0GBW4_9GAMM|nr:Imm31 family immunity protein [Photorhabdus tasmaniensis]NHB86455.1 hypothetical protein [Photorhabdus tasmaniensis]
MINKIDFFQEVKIVSSKGRPEFIGRNGVIVGISEEDGILYGYAARVDGYEYVVCFEPDELEPTGKKFKREDFY